MPKRPMQGTKANTADPDQSPQNAASDQILRYLHYKNVHLALKMM